MAASTASSTSHSGDERDATGSGNASGGHEVPERVGPYIVQEEIGVGTFSSVRKAIHVPTGRTVALKILNREKLQSLDMDRKIRREIEILRRFRHPHVIKLFEVIDTPKDIFLALEYVPRGELFDHIVKQVRLPEDEARRIFQQIISGVECCHHMMVVHRDLKPENLLLDDDGNVRIADFGLSNFMQAGFFLKTSCGSPNYAAPEVISGNLYVGPEVDVWSCGVILYALLCGSLPFDDPAIPKLFHKIKNGIYTLPEALPDGARDLISTMLVVNPLKRITIPEVRNHPWFRENLPKYLSRPASELISDYEEVDEDALELVSHQLGASVDDILNALDCQDSLLSLDQPAEGGLSVEERIMVVTYQLFTDRKRMFQKLVEEYDPDADSSSTSVPLLRHPRLYGARRDSNERQQLEAQFTLVEETTEDIEAERRLDESPSPARTPATAAAAAAAASAAAAAAVPASSLDPSAAPDAPGSESDAQKLPSPSHPEAASAAADPSESPASDTASRGDKEATTATTASPSQASDLRDVRP